MLDDGSAGDAVISDGWTVISKTTSNNGHTYAVHNASTGADLALLLIDINVNRTGITL